MPACPVPAAPKVNHNNIRFVTGSKDSFFSPEGCSPVFSANIDPILTSDTSKTITNKHYIRNDHFKMRTLVFVVTAQFLVYLIIPSLISRWEYSNRVHGMVQVH